MKRPPVTIGGRFFIPYITVGICISFTGQLLGNQG